VTTTPEKTTTADNSDAPAVAPAGYPLAGAPVVVGHPDFPELERGVLAYWAKDKTFQASIDARPAGDNGANEYVFYDGPPFANGLKGAEKRNDKK
jgi:hypothetical protein